MLFSVTIPAYKTEYLKEAIESVLNQEYSDFELIIVDDCSPNNVFAIVSQFKDHRIRYYRNDYNFGALHVVDNWNKCLSYSKGDYIICMGDDDRLCSNCLLEYSKIISKYPQIGLLHGWTEIINEQSEVIGITTQRCAYESAYSLAWHRWNAYKQQYIGDFCFNIHWLRLNGGFYKLPMAWASDDISAIIGAMKNGVANTDRVVFQYRESHSTISNSDNYIYKVQAIRKEEKWYRLFLEQSSSLNKEDSLYMMQLRRQINMHFSNKMIHCISQDLSISRWRLFYWINNINEYRISFSIILKALLRSR